MPGTALAVKMCPRPEMVKPSNPQRSYSVHTVWSLAMWKMPMQLLLTLRRNQFCNEDPAAYLLLPFNFTIFIMSVLVVCKVSVETQPAC